MNTDPPPFPTAIPPNAPAFTDEDERRELQSLTMKEIADVEQDLRGITSDVNGLRLGSSAAGPDDDEEGEKDAGSRKKRKGDKLSTVVASHSCERSQSNLGRGSNKNCSWVRHGTSGPLDKGHGGMEPETTSGLSHYRSETSRSSTDCTTSSTGRCCL